MARTLATRARVTLVTPGEVDVGGEVVGVITPLPQSWLRVQRRR